MSSTIFLSVSALIYTIIIAIMFFKKEKINKTENTIYKYLLITTILSCIIELSIPFFEATSLAGVLTQKTFLAFIIIWFSLFVTYTYVVAKKDGNKNLENSKKTLKYFIAFNFIVSILVYILPIYFYNNESAKYTYGPAVNVVFSIVGIYISYLVIVLIKHLKSIKKENTFL